MNGGTELNYKKMRAGESNGMFELLEEVISRTAVEGLQGDEFFMSLVDFRNIKAGDENVFELKDDIWFEVSKVAPGVRGLRRQRVSGSETKTLHTEMRGVRIYEHLRRLLAGRVDFNEFIDAVAKSMRRDMLDDVYTCFAGLTDEQLGGEDFAAAGTYDEEVLLDIIQHVEAVSGKKARILGTPKALRKLAPSIQGLDSQSDLYNVGYYGKFYGRDTMAIAQRHKVGTTEFIFPDNTIYVVAADSKPIKCVYEGQTIIKQTDALDNADMTQEYECYDMYGIGFISAGNDGFGRYTFS